MCRRGFTLLEMMVAATVFATIFGMAAMLYVYTTRQTTHALLMNNLVGQVTYIDQYIEHTIENSTSCSTNVSGSYTALVCSMPKNGATYDDAGVYTTYTPNNASNGSLHWGTGNTRWFYWSNSTGNYGSGLLGLLFGSGGNMLWMAEVPNSGTNPSSSTAVPKWNWTQGTTSSSYKFYLIDTFNPSVNSTNHSVTYTIAGSVLDSTDAPVGSSTDTANSHTFSITRTVYWRNST